MRIAGFDLQLPVLLVQLTPSGPEFLTGGPAGPESSILTIGMLTLATLPLLLFPKQLAEKARMPPDGVA